MQIMAVIIFPNTPKIYHLKSRYRYQNIGWATTIWKLENDGRLYWVPQSGPFINTLSTEKKRLFASEIAKKFGCKIIYLDKKRASNSIKSRGTFGMFRKIPFRQQDLQ